MTDTSASPSSHAVADGPANASSVELFTWFWQDGDSNWIPFRRSDQQPLEKAEASSSSFVNVEGGRWQVDLKERLVTDRYGSDPPRKPGKVRRALWFQQAATLIPYDEETSKTIEAAHERVWLGAKEALPKEDLEVAESVVLDSGRQVTLKLKYEQKSKSWKLSAKERSQGGSSWMEYAQGMLGKTYQLQRGFGPVDLQPGEEEEKALGDKVGNLIILVHGVGEKMWSEEGCGLAFSSVQFRQHTHVKQLLSAGFVQKGSGWEYPGEVPPPSLQKDEVLEASWWETIHTDEMDKRLARISLPSMKQVRQIANFAVVDALYYMQVGRKEAIVAAVARSVEAALARFLKHHPHHSGSIVLAGHSLGGAILFELLRSQTPKLSFAPGALFTMGSPTGLFLHVADSAPEESFALPGGTRFFNIFHPLDPVAYRIEPLIKEDLEKLEPAKVAVEGGIGGMKVHYGVQKMMNWATGEDKKQAEFSDLCQSVQLNAGDRIDWSLQEDLSIMTVAGVAGELVQALPSHACYMKSADVAAFVQSRTHSLAVARRLASKTESSSDANRC
ncbi:Ddhd2 [Symbiodinium necroappetens]|uniref:Ddhd2 protein n=1 Tax=Symbiodinium necroappetens TaxID=1628268 RepID=A0A812LQB2_9DINO|nr:Ddhd2 [Symbiodinium necroappetens]